MLKRKIMRSQMYRVAGDLSDLEKVEMALDTLAQRAAHGRSIEQPTGGRGASRAASVAKYQLSRR
jgi:hypothetical protein